MVNLKDNSYRMKTQTGEYLTFKLDMTAMLRLENIVGSSVEATRIFLDLFKPGSNCFYKKGLEILCACCVEKPDLTLEEFNRLFPLNNHTFTQIDHILTDLVAGYFADDEDEAQKK